MTKNLVIDMDGCIAEFNLGLLKILRSINPSVKVDEYDSSFPKVWHWPIYYGWSEEEYSRAMTEVANSPMFWEFLFPTTNGYADTAYLADVVKHHNVYFATTRFGDTCKAQTERWLARYGLAGATVVVTKKDGKQAFCQSIEADLIVDDYWGNLSMQGKTATAMIRRPYNEYYWDEFKPYDSVWEALRDVV